MNQIDIKCKKNAEISSALSVPKLSDWSIKAGITQAKNQASDLSAKKSPALKRLAAFFSIILAFSCFSPCLSSCSFMDSQWGSEESSSGSEKKNNATITAYTNSEGKRIGITLNFMVVLKELTIPETIAGEKVLALNFEDVATKTSTQKITFPTSVIKFDSLAGFTALSELTLSENLSSIKEKSFTNCKNLKTITCPAVNPPQINDSKFSSDLSSLQIIYVPYSSQELYKESQGWDSFAEKIQPIASTVPEEENENQNENESGDNDNSETGDGNGTE
ncbi:MAG: leucine-rich repeat domain-containing protein [Treponema sp.]|nr:leucine-rich repeat domain-containing protein [Treponema sp.]